MILRGGIELTETHLPANQKRRSCQCENPEVIQLPRSGNVMPRGGLPSWATPGYLIREPESNPALTGNRPVGATLRLCRRCAVALAVAILELEVL